jgi:hypothetical protein
VRRLAGCREHFVELGRQLDDDQILAVGPESLNISPGADQQQHVAELKLFVQEPALVRD